MPTLHDKYSPQFNQAFSLASLLSGKSSNDYEFTGVNTIHVTTIVSQALADYSRSTGLGSATEVADYVQDHTLSQAKSFNMKIDKLNELDQVGLNKVGKSMKAEIDEQIVPYFDKWALFQWGYHAGNSVVLGAAITKSNIVGYIAAARTAFTNAKVPAMDRYIALKATNFALVLQSPEFLAVDTSIGKVVENGVVGKIVGFKVVEVPDDYLPTSCEFICWHKNAVLAPVKSEETRITNSEDFFGKLLQGLFYGDAFVSGAKAGGVYAALTNGSSVKVAKPTATQDAVNKAEYTLASGTAGSTVKYTLDGSDPRYSATAVSVATGTVITLTAAVTGAKFVAIKANMFDSDVLTQDCPIT